MQNDGYAVLSIPISAPSAQMIKGRNAAGDRP